MANPEKRTSSLTKTCNTYREAAERAGIIKYPSSGYNYDDVKVIGKTGDNRHGLATFETSIEVPGQERYGWRGILRDGWEILRIDDGDEFDVVDVSPDLLQVVYLKAARILNASGEPFLLYGLYLIDENGVDIPLIESRDVLVYRGQRDQFSVFFADREAFCEPTLNEDGSNEVWKLTLDKKGNKKSTSFHVERDLLRVY